MELNTASVPPPLNAPDEVLGGEAASSQSLKKKLLGLFMGIVGFVVALSIGSFIGTQMTNDVSWGFSTWQRLTLVVAILLPLPLILAIHEAGHLLGGRIAGFNFSLFVVGPLMISRSRQGLEVSLNKSLSMYGGLAASYPTDTHNLQRRMLWMIIGGPGMSLLAGCIFIGLRLLLLPEAAHPDTHSVLYLYLWLELMVMGLASLFIGFITLFPGKTGGFLTDGARLRLLLKGGAEASREEALWLITTRSLSGVRPRHWDAETIQKAVALKDDSPFEYAVHMLAYYHALDMHHFADTHKHLSRCLEMWDVLPPPIRPSLSMEAAYFEAACRHDAPAARAWLDATREGPFVDDAAKIRGKAAVLIAEGHLDEARSLASCLDEALRQNVDEGMVIAQKDWVDRLFASTSATRLVA